MLCILLKLQSFVNFPALLQPNTSKIGYTHGKGAVRQIRRSIAFYTAYFQEKSKLSWSQAVEAASHFKPLLDSHYPDYVTEMQGIAAGASSEVATTEEITFGDILALNCRTEIAMGLMNDGCTAFSYSQDKEHSSSFPSTILAQNWDWDQRQQDSVVFLTVARPGSSTITTMTEGGILAKIGFNDRGVGCTLNAIRAKGVNYRALPVHLALRNVLDSTSADEAVSRLVPDRGGIGVAAACHILVADVHTRVGLECSSADIVLIQESNLNKTSPESSALGKVVLHTNHFCTPHKPQPIGETMGGMPDSGPRLARIEELLQSACQRDERGLLSFDSAEKVLEDTKGAPGAINRIADGDTSTSATLFRIVMDLTMKRARVTMGRPGDGGEVIEWQA